MRKRKWGFAEWRGAGKDDADRTQDAGRERQRPDAPAAEQFDQADLVQAEQVEMPARPDGQAAPDAASKADKKGRFWSRLGHSLAKTRRQIASGVGDLLLGKRTIDDDVLDELETSLLAVDVGFEATERIMESLKARVSRRELADTVALHGALREKLIETLAPLARPFAVGAERPYVVLMVGVNGAGKTTLIGKLARRLQAEGHSVLLAAGDTFRAAAVEQLQIWGERNGVPVVAQRQGSDSASVIFDAIRSAESRGIDVVLADTAGRLQAKAGLMEELKKIKRVMSRLGGAPHEAMLVLDAGVGQNALSQVSLFNEAVGVTSLALTKLDGTAKAGVLVALASVAAPPVSFIGTGEGIDDLAPFEPQPFVDALLERS